MIGKTKKKKKNNTKNDNHISSILDSIHSMLTKKNIIKRRESFYAH